VRPRPEAEFAISSPVPSSTHQILRKARGRRRHGFVLSRQMSSLPLISHSNVRRMTKRRADNECSDPGGIEEHKFAVGACRLSSGVLRTAQKDRPGRSEGVLSWEVKWFVLPVAQGTNLPLCVLS
jgi:hypothetical protein